MPGGSIYQDVPAAVSTGQTFCASLELSTLNTSGGGGGSLVLWLLGGRANDYSDRAVANVPGNAIWSQQQVCVMATTPHSVLRIQFYPAVNGPTMALDDASITPDRAVNGGFNAASGFVPAGPWGAFPGTNMRATPRASAA